MDLAQTILLNKLIPIIIHCTALLEQVPGDGYDLTD